MPKGLKRYYGQRQLHFVTFSCYGRLPPLGTAHARDRQEYEFLLAGYVVMPNHVHLLVSEPKKGTPSTVLQMLKQRVSRKMRMASGGSPARLPQFWLPRFYDFNVYSHEKKKEKLEYMHANPVQRGLVEHPKDWLWSSFLWYAKGEPGLVTIDPVD